MKLLGILWVGKSVYPTLANAKNFTGTPKACQGAIGDTVGNSPEDVL
jgi:hypothetical protein